MSNRRHVLWLSLVPGLLFVAGSLAIYVVVFPRPDVVDGPNPIVLVYASWVLAALGGIRLGTTLHRWLGHDGRLGRVGADLACVMLVAGLTQGSGWLLDPSIFEWSVLRTYVWFVLVFGASIVVIREAGRLLVRALRRVGARRGDTASQSHD